MSDATEEKEGNCSNSDCRVSETGQCFEGLELEACPHFGFPEETEDTVERDDTEPVGMEEAIELPSATVLSYEGASRVLRKSDSRVIAVLGPTDSGKTSLIAGVYELFQRGAVGNIRFSGSQTLHGFEEISHDARSASRRNTPDAVRTPVGTVAFYHLELGRENETISVLLADRSGEEYRSAADDIGVVEEFEEIGRSDSVSILIDGEKLLSGDRHNMVSELKMMLQAIKDGNGLVNNVSLAVVLTKLDAVESSDERDRGMEAFERLVREIRKLFGDNFAAIEVFRVAASPKTGGAAKGEGLDELLAFWMVNRRLVATRIGKEVMPSRAFGGLRMQEPGDDDVS